MDNILAVIPCLFEQEFTLPPGEVLVFVLLHSFCLLMGKYKPGLLVPCCFVLYRGFVKNLKYFVDLPGDTSWGMPLCVFSGIAMLFLTLAGFLLQERDASLPIFTVLQRNGQGLHRPLLKGFR